MAPEKSPVARPGGALASAVPEKQRDHLGAVALREGALPKEAEALLPFR